MKFLYRFPPRFGGLSRSCIYDHGYYRITNDASRMRTKGSVFFKNRTKRRPLASRAFHSVLVDWTQQSKSSGKYLRSDRRLRTFRPDFKCSRAGSSCCWATRCWRCSRSISAPPSASSSSVCFSCARRTGPRTGKTGSRICNRRSISTCSSPSPSRPAAAGFPCTFRAIPSFGSWTLASRTPPSPAPRCNCTPASRRFHARAATRWTCGTRSCPRRTWSDSWRDRVSSGSKRGPDLPVRRSRCCCRRRSNRWEWVPGPTTVPWPTCSSTTEAELRGI